MKKLAILIALVFLILSIHLVVRVELTALSYRRTNAVLLERKLEEENRRLKSELGRLKSRRNLEKLGKRLGLCPPREDQIVFVGR